VKRLQATNTTALGPAMLASIALAGEGKPGSQVIVCTDGLANFGLGALQGAKSSEANDFYLNLGEYA